MLKIVGWDAHMSILSKEIRSLKREITMILVFYVSLCCVYGDLDVHFVSGGVLS